MKPRIKICGITTLADARFCAGAGADMLGYIQYARSPRYIAPQEVAAIGAWIHGPKSVGVFVNEEIETINRAVELAGFEKVQLHGEESPSFCRRISRPVIKAFRVGPEMSSDQLTQMVAAYEDVAEHILLDTWHRSLPGGTGQTFDWSLARALRIGRPLILSGGLSPENILAAVQSVDPWGIDLSSSLESSPGHKDFDRVGSLFAVLENSDA
ncbi:MAG: phosphoribosylanthranilate isomerase [Bacteroidota bacterium]|nr:phosphoribosylanthranilate isomerase [Bacteroidota bacterium]MDE2833353.1 phosphoribosylanthranilate isomerase [Bacteroidota bacterium]MDE2956383.1 phosphoribosylanthranilate isomerase [Bacteroidota bacterium]